MVKAYNAFTFKLLAQLIHEKPKVNLFASPFGAASVLSVADHGARGATRDELREVRGLRGLTDAQIASSIQTLLRSLRATDAQATLQVANSRWVGSNAVGDTRPEFVRDAREYFDADAATVDFRSPAAVSLMNDWVARRTAGRITGIVPPRWSPNGNLVLLNAVYFKGQWSAAFPKKDTRPEAFTLLDGTKRPHPLMQQRNRFAHQVHPWFEAIRLPYGRGDFSVYVFLPSQGDFLDRLSYTNWVTWLSGFCEEGGRLRHSDGIIELPRFRLDQHHDLGKTLLAVGLHSAFAPHKAEFDGITPLSAWIDSVRQDSWLQVDEEGTEAAATTRVDILYAGLPPQPPPPQIHMIVNRPFLFVLRDDLTSLVLFVGVVVDPG